jgi:hypothetical protein
VHTVPHAPQFIGSVCGSMQVLLQTSRGDSQSHRPATQPTPDGHTLRHAPQFALSVCGSTQLPAQFAWPIGHDAASTAASIAGTSATTSFIRASVPASARGRGGSPHAASTPASAPATPSARGVPARRKRKAIVVIKSSRAPFGTLRKLTRIGARTAESAGAGAACGDVVVARRARAYGELTDRATRRARARV